MGINENSWTKANARSFKYSVWIYLLKKSCDEIHINKFKLSSTVIHKNVSEQIL